MTRRAVSPAVIIKRRHQSAPKSHPIDAAIRSAADEIVGGRYVEDSEGRAVLDKLGLSLGLGNRGAAVGMKPTLDDFQTTRELNQIGRHPRVLEALELLRAESEDEKTPEQVIEMHWKMHEMNQLDSESQKWEGQERWQGKENEEMRIGKVMTPQAFHAQLCTVIGVDRIILSNHAVKQKPTDKSGRVGLYVRNPLWKGINPSGEYKQVKAAEIKSAGLKAFDEARRFRKAGANAMADRKFNFAAECAQAATEMMMEIQGEEESNPELLRVASLQWPLGTEWMMMHFNEFNVPTEAKYIGWRTALLCLVRTKAITEAEAHKAFPVATESEVAQWYLEQLYMLRNREIRVN